MKKNDDGIRVISGYKLIKDTWFGMRELCKEIG